MLVLDSGDLLFKKYFNPISENELKGMSEKALLIIESFNLTGYDALGIGDDDLNLGKEFLLEISKKANFPFLSSNLFDEASGKILFQSSLIKETNGLRIGIFSLLSPDFFTSPSDSRRKGLNIRSPVETAQAMVKELKPKTDFIILLSHLVMQRTSNWPKRSKGSISSWVAIPGSISSTPRSSKTPLSFKPPPGECSQQGLTFSSIITNRPSTIRQPKLLWRIPSTILTSN